MKRVLVRFVIGCQDVICVCMTFIFCLLSLQRWKSSWRFWGRPLVFRRSGSQIVFGEGLVARSTCRSNSLGVQQPVIIRTCTHGAKIILGNHVGLSGCSIVAYDSIRVGDFVQIGTGALITDSDAHALNPMERRHGDSGVAKPIVIEDDVFVGARAIVLKGVTIGRCAVIGAGAVVTHNVEPYAIVAGNPARVVGRVPMTKNEL